MWRDLDGMPRGKSASKSTSETDGATDQSNQRSTVEMKDIDALDIIGEEGKCEASVEAELPNNITNMSADVNTECNEDDSSSLPRKPKRVFTIAGSKKKDAKPKSAGKTRNNKRAKATSTAGRNAGKRKQY